MTAITREEQYLAYLNGTGTSFPKPITRVEKYLYDLCVKGGIGSGVTDEQIKNAVDAYLTENPVQSGATQEQAEQIEQNKEDISKLSEEIADLTEAEFWIEDDGKTYVDNKITDLKAQGVQQTPLFANSVADCTDTSKVYVLPDGYIYGYITKLINPTNQLKKAINKDGTPYNGGQGWETNIYLGVGDGIEKASTGYESTGFIPYKYTDTFRAKDLTLEEDHGYNTIIFYDSDFNFIKGFSMNSGYNPMSQFVKTDGTVEGRIADSITSNITTEQKQSIAYFRISCIVISDSTVITVNEPLEPSEFTGWQTTGHAFIPADYEDRILKLEEEVANNENTGVVSLNSNTCSIFRKVVCCGDSFTAGYINIGNGVQETNEDYAWVSFMARLTGNEYINCGASGATVLTWQTTSRGLPKARTSGVAQAYLVGLGINDTSNVTLGTSADIGTENQTYYGGLSKIIRELNAISPNAKIFIQTMPTNSETRQAYNEAMRTIVEIYRGTYQVHLLDLDAYKSLYFIPSITGDSIGGHYTAIAYQQYAENLRFIWSKYINENISDFQDVYSLPYESGDVFGYVDENNTIVLTGNLPSGDYSIKYEMEDGSTIDIGNLVLDSNVTYVVTNNLTNCTNSNSATQIIEGESYTATITANDGYELSSVSVTMDGVDITSSAVNDGNISVAAVTGDIVITAVAEVVTQSVVNLIPTLTDTDLTTIYNEVGYKEDTRVSISSVSASNPTGVITQAGTTLLGLMPLGDDGDVLHLRGAKICDYSLAQYSALTWYYNASGALLNTGQINVESLGLVGTDANGDDVVNLNHSKMSLIEGTAYIRFNITNPTGELIMTRNQLIPV